jgi:peptidyl-prolyl cis-trans isomerase D
LSNDSLLALRLLDLKPARQKTLEEVRNEIVMAIKQQRAGQRARELGRDIVLAARKGGSLVSLARKHRVRHTPAKSLKRDSKGVDQKLLDAVFAAKRPTAKQKMIDGIDLGANGFAVYAVSRVTDGDPKKLASKEGETIRKQIEKRKGSGYYYNYLYGLRGSGKVKIFYDQL